ncbi:MAG: hypothetical protein EHM50_04810 [Lysobacterales bacterium]|nr:MAG: hypothetical protein EHM50_04810 [Xanthomonadales bacterium]
MRVPLRVSLILAAGSLALPILAQQGVAGRWNASIDTPQGPFAFAFEFLVDAAGKLSGAMHNELFGSTPIKDGAVDGNDVSFKLTFDAPDGAMTISYTGTVKGDELALTSKFEGAPPGGGPAEQSFTAKRAQ